MHREIFKLNETLKSEIFSWLLWNQHKFRRLPPYSINNGFNPFDRFKVKIRVVIANSNSQHKLRVQITPSYVRSHKSSHEVNFKVWPKLLQLSHFSTWDDMKTCRRWAFFSRNVWTSIYKSFILIKSTFVSFTSFSPCTLTAKKTVVCHDLPQVICCQCECCHTESSGWDVWADRKWQTTRSNTAARHDVDSRGTAESRQAAAACGCHGDVAQLPLQLPHSDHTSYESTVKSGQRCILSYRLGTDWTAASNPFLFVLSHLLSHKSLTFGQMLFCCVALPQGCKLA